MRGRTGGAPSTRRFKLVYYYVRLARGARGLHHEPRPAAPAASPAGARTRDARRRGHEHRGARPRDRAGGRGASPSSCTSCAAADCGPSTRCCGSRSASALAVLAIFPDLLVEVSDLFGISYPPATFMLLALELPAHPGAALLVGAVPARRPHPRPRRGARAAAAGGRGAATPAVGERVGLRSRVSRRRGVPTPAAPRRSGRRPRTGRPSRRQQPLDAQHHAGAGREHATAGIGRRTTSPPGRTPSCSNGSHRWRVSSASSVRHVNNTTWSGWLTSTFASRPRVFTKPMAFGVVTISTPSSARSACRPSRNEPGSSRCSMTSPATTTSAGGSPRARDRLDVAAVDRVRHVAAGTCPLDPGLVEVETDQLTRRGGQVLVQPCARLQVQLLAAGVGEPDVHHPKATAALPQVLEPVDQRGRRERVHHLELGVLRHALPLSALTRWLAPWRPGYPAAGVRSHVGGSASRSIGGSRSARRSASGGPARPRSAASMLGERAAAVVPEQAAAHRSGFGHHPERLAGVEVVGVAVGPEHLAGARDPREPPGSNDPGSARR